MEYINIKAKMMVEKSPIKKLKKSAKMRPATPTLPINKMQMIQTTISIVTNK